jgi:hypothetical protein
MIPTYHNLIAEAEPVERRNEVEDVLFVAVGCEVAGEKEEVAALAVDGGELAVGV